MGMHLLFGGAAVAVLLAQTALLHRHARAGWRVHVAIVALGALVFAAVMLAYAHAVGPLVHPAPLESEAPR